MKVNLIKVRGIISLLLLILFIVISVTGIGLWLAPSGRIARQIEWSFLGLNKELLEDLHTYTGFIMIFLTIVHLLLNYKMLFNEIKHLLKR
ncbi:hypothetical protein BBF96_05090 [Anoxybacter fermentans]|uniref:Flavinylation-associated cytochrome domain-containing protein n=1 Tax=Anoxybacter fermentans TaxID=1323375 RepID=A0A3Q9HPL4_9FIRM|nr:DUF4405 domain-containing protein [Anoxybacter fermentans]AZR72822.1 hypothetical protein BBF96_05090 [Anoxybacter fermentans]